HVIPAARAEDTILTHSHSLADQPTPLEARSSGPLTGKVRVPGDKSISHRALILGALAVGETRVSGLLGGEDVLTTAKAVRARGAQGGRAPLPLTLNGARDPLPILYRTPVASAQIKSAVLLAGLAAPGITTVIESEASRDHTELMLKHFGARIVSTREGSHGRRIALTGHPELHGAAGGVPPDPSSAAFPIVAAMIVPGSETT